MIHDKRAMRCYHCASLGSETSGRPTNRYRYRVRYRYRYRVRYRYRYRNITALSHEPQNRRFDRISSMSTRAWRTKPLRSERCPSNWEWIDSDPDPSTCAVGTADRDSDSEKNVSRREIGRVKPLPTTPGAM